MVVVTVMAVIMTALLVLMAMLSLLVAVSAIAMKVEAVVTVKVVLVVGSALGSLRCPPHGNHDTHSPVREPDSRGASSCGHSGLRGCLGGDRLGRL